MDHLDSIPTFAAVAKAGSFAEAARELRRSPSVVTRSIAQLEDHLGITVLRRTTRSVRVTERGRIYLDRCEQIGEHPRPPSRDVGAMKQLGALAGVLVVAVQVASADGPPPIAAPRPGRQPQLPRAGDGRPLP